MSGKLLVEFRGKPRYEDDAALHSLLVAMAKRFGYKFFSAVSAPKHEDDKVTFVRDEQCVRHRNHRNEEVGMPFKKVGKNKYKGPSGKTFNKKQVKLYYSLGGKFPGQKMTLKKG